MRQDKKILSSGLVAIAGDVGKKFEEGDDPVQYNKKNDFPHTLDNIDDGGLKFVTKYSSPCYPNTKLSKLSRFFKKTKNLFKMVCDNVYTVVNVKGDLLVVEVYNQNRVLLDYEEYPL